MDAIWIVFEEDQYGNTSIKEWSSAPIEEGVRYLRHYEHEGNCVSCYNRAGESL
jgi:hypothetical protein